MDLNKAPTDLNSTTVLAFSENQPVGTVIGEFNATDPEGGAITYHFVNGENNNSLFTLDTNGTLKTATTFDYETNASTYTITVLAKDELNATTEGNFTVHLTNDPTSVFTVAGGSGTAPYYQFTNGLGQTVDFTNLTLIPGEVYEFMAYGISGSHPFMIGGSYGDADSTLVSGGPLSADWEVLTVTIPLDYWGDLYYFCTNHASMVQQFDIAQPATHSVDLNNSVAMEMIWVEPGAFSMGQAGVSEPVHNVTLTNGFYLGKFEVTQAQYEAVMTGNDQGLSDTPSQWPNNPNRPVENVSWNEFQVFLELLNAQEVNNLPEGWKFVLPTGSAVGVCLPGGHYNRVFLGDTIVPSDANWNHGNDANQTVDVGQYSANPWGFFDMHGNVYEWTSDWYAPYASVDRIDPEGPAYGDVRVFRGGSFTHGPESLKSNFRQGPEVNYGPDNSFIFIGFRLARLQNSTRYFRTRSISDWGCKRN